MIITQYPSFNNHPRHRDVLGIVIHVMESDIDTATEWFQKGSKAAGDPVSAHYGVAKDGSIRQYVSEDCVAYHAGRVDHPTAQIVIDRPTINPNDYMIGIEHEGDGTQEMTVLQRTASTQLIKDICIRNKIPIDRYHIVGHHEIYQPKTCPGGISVDALVILVGEQS